jgi:hypothetical protein
VAAGSAGCLAAATAVGGALPASGSMADVFVCVTPDVTAGEIKLQVTASPQEGKELNRDHNSCMRETSESGTGRALAGTTKSFLGARWSAGC